MKNGKIFIIILSLTCLSLQLKAQWKMVYDSGFRHFGPLLFADKDNIVACNDYGIMISRDSGKSWQQTGTIPDMQVINKFIRKDSLLLASASERVYKSSDSGRSWAIQANWPYGKSYMNIVQSGDYLLAFSDIDRVVRSTDNGRTWDSSNTGLPPAMNHRPPTHVRSISGFGIIDNKVLLCSDDDQYISYDHGLTWHLRKAHSGKGGSLTTFRTRLLVPGHALSVSDDTGSTWTSVFTADATADGAGGFGYDDKYIVASIMNEGIIFSRDSGSHWYFVNDGLSSPEAVNVVLTSNFAYCGSQGKVFRRPLAEMVGIENEPGKKYREELSHLEIYPNPMLHSATVKFGRALHNGIFCLYDLNGKKVQEFSNISNESITLYKGELASGLYVYVLSEAGTKLAFGKLEIE